MDELGWGAMMTLAGMGAVFALLALLMGLLFLIARLDRRGAAPGESRGQQRPEDAALTVLDGEGLDDEAIAAIAVAVLKHAEVRRLQAAPETRVVAPGSQLFASRWVAIGRGLQNAAWRRG